MIAFDVSKHYKENFQGTGLKGQLVAPSKYTAILFKKALDMLGDIKTEVVISETQKTDAEEDKIETHKKVVEDFMYIGHTWASYFICHPESNRKFRITVFPG